MTEPFDPEAHVRPSALSSDARRLGALDLLPIGLYHSTPGGRFLDANDALVRLLGFQDRDQLMAAGSPGLYSRPADRAQWLELLGREGVVSDYETRLRRADGSEIWVRDSAHATRDDRGQMVSVVGALVDITRHKEADELLRRSEERFLLAARATKDTLWDWDFATDDIWWNEGITTQFGYAPQQAGGMPEWVERIHPDDRERVVASLHRVAESGAHVWLEEYRFRRANGSYAAVYDRGYVLRDGQGQPMRMIGAVMDVTERQTLETQLRHAQKMEAVGRLAGGIAHDFNNLLTAILGHTDMVLGELPADDRHRPPIEDVRAAAQRAATLTGQLLAFSRRQTLQPRPLDLNQVVSSMEQMLRRLIGEDVRLVTRLDERIGAVRADQSQVEQVVANLVVNARDALPRGGTVRLETANAVIGATARGPAPGPYVRLTVHDDGVGMTPDVMASIFEPFFTTKEIGKGTGLGLATVYGIVQQSGGHIEVRSELGAGATFDVYLPRLPDEPAAPASDAADAPAAGGSETILLVEDEAAVRRLARRVLERHGYVVLEAADGPAALILSAARSGPIHLLVTDVVMPGMRGDELARRLCGDRKELGVLYISGYTDGAVDLATAHAAGHEFLAKPFMPDALARTVRGLLDRRRKRR